MCKNMTTLTERAINSDKIGGGFFIAPRIPRGLAAAVESLTREVIRQRPKDIYTFAARHFENLMQQREYCHHDRNDGVKTVSTKCNNWNKWSHYQDTEMTMNCGKRKIEEKLTKASLGQQRIHNGSSVNADTTICPKIIIEQQAIKDETTKQERKSISESKSRTKTDTNIDKFSGHMINPSTNHKSFNNLQEKDNIMEIQDIIHSCSGPTVLNKKLKILHKSHDIRNKNFEARLAETRNLLEDISSGFSTKHNEHDRPRSADSITNDKRQVTDKLRVMISDTRDLLVDISASFLNGSLLSGIQETRNIDENYIRVPSILPAVDLSPISPSTRSTLSSLDKNRTGNIEDTGDTKNICRLFSLPPVMIDCATETAPISDKLAKTGQDFTLPLLMSSSENRFDRVDECIEDIHSIESTREMVADNDNRKIEKKSMMESDKHRRSEHIVDDNSQLPKYTEVLDFDPCHGSSTGSIEGNFSYDNIQDNTTTRMAIIPQRDDVNNEDPSLESFGEKIIATTTVRPLQNVIESLVDELSSISSMMNRVVKLHHQRVDLHCINEEEDAIDGHFHAEELNNVENITLGKCKCQQNGSTVASMDYKDIQVDGCNEQQDESERSSSAKETSITDEVLIGSTVCIENSGTSNHCSVSTEMCESSNEAKETTLTDGISLSLDDPMRPFVPELNLDSLQDVTVSSFKMTEDDLYEDNTNSVVETPTSSYQYNQHDGEVLSGEIDAEYSSRNREIRQSEEIIDTNNILRNHIQFECDRGEMNTPYGNVSRCGSRCTTRRVNSDDLTCKREDKSLVYDEHRENSELINYENQDGRKDRDGVLCSIGAVIKIQACVRGFLTRRRYQSKTSLGDNHSHVDTDADVLIDLDVQCEEAKMLELLDTTAQIIGSDSRGHRVGKRLCRGNAIIEHTATMSIDDEHLVRVNYSGRVNKNNTLQHTGEFHDWIVLPMLDHYITANNGEFNVIMTTKMNGCSTSRNKEENSRSQLCIGNTIINNKDTENIIEYCNLNNDMKWFSRLPILHLGLNKNMRDIVIDNIVLLSNNGMIFVQRDHHIRRLMSLTPLSSHAGVIIREITDTSPETLVEMHPKVDHNAHDEHGNSSSSSSSSEESFEPSIIIDAKVMHERKEDVV